MEDSGQQARRAALGLLARRAHASAELYRKLKRRFDEDSCRAAIEEMETLGLLCDEGFARQKAEEMHRKGKSAYQIRQALQAAGIRRCMAEPAVAALQEKDGQAALYLIRKKYREILAQGRREKVLAALTRRGFAHGQAMAALRQAEEELQP